MLLSKQITRDEHSTFRKEIFYNDKKDILATRERTIINENGTENGMLSVYEYSGQDYRIIRFESGSESYSSFQPGLLLAGKRDWYNIKEAHSTQECKFENGRMVADHYHNIQFDYKQLVNYTYKDGVKVAETQTKEDGSVYKSTFTYEQGQVKTKLTLLNDQFLDLINYMYRDGQLVQEDRTLKYKDTQFTSTSKKYFYAGKELTRTEYYGTYAGKFPLYKVEENIRKGNMVTSKFSMISNLEMVIGYYDLAALHEWLKKNNMEGILPFYTKDFLSTAVFDASSCQIDTFDDKGTVTEMKIMHPYDHNKEMTKMTFRNEYNDNGLLEFTLVYGQTEEGEMKEREIRKYYYRD
ncbi:hypothetical protein F0L74_23440 [Chitinophaga agrisoli]|uniref:YD repeat-containing protein n=1 Tax=Chitinophaga agrisoli TaxID=2607653 RepID=A0A5B2VHV2_9BACT|nr:hypothetical protein [Chitinophaga agrisoli]KAA2239163.1 hypothetical protein F0L74_23440 [Chitinophaga agrisoli]